MSRFLGLAFALLLAGSASAQSPGGMTAATVGVTAAVLIPAGAGPAYREVLNVSATATVCLSIGGTPTITGTQCGGTGAIIPIAPLWAVWWPVAGQTYVPTDAISAIASAATTPVTVGLK
jgi:hypothetical protein